jgi:hypothetical protein
VLRLVKQVLNLSADQVLDPAAALLRADSSTPVVFVDDIAGTGAQMDETRNLDIRRDTPRSFTRLYSKHEFEARFLCALATETATEHLARVAPPLKIQGLLTSVWKRIRCMEGRGDVHA